MFASIPALLSNRPFESIERQPLVGVDGSVLGELTLTPYIRTHALLDRASDDLLDLQRAPARELFAAFKAAAQLLRGDDWSFASIPKPAYFDLVAASTGLPREAMPRELEEIADLLDRLDEVTLAQLPTADHAPLDRNRYPSRDPNRDPEVGFYPSGHSLLVKLPGNVPTIAYYWLVPLALKRPLLLVPSPEDPFTHLVVLEAIRAVAPWLSRCVHYLPCDASTLQRLAGEVDQVIIPQSAIDRRAPRWLHRAHLIHHGQSKLVVTCDWSDELVDVAWRRMMWNFGRTCTGLSSVLLGQRGRAFAEALCDRAMAEFADVARVDRSRLAACSVERGQQIDAMITGLLGRGVEDLTASRRGNSRLVIADRRATLLPTVLFVRDLSSPALGLELPFPFVTVAEVPEARVLDHSRDTLILSFVGSEPMFARLCHEPSIHKVFAGPHIERGFVATDPHEGYMIDFLYRRKAALS